jgi:hypothetical protein
VERELELHEPVEVDQVGRHRRVGDDPAAALYLHALAHPLGHPGNGLPGRPARGIGRYMSDKVRPGVEREQAERWLSNVARRMSRHFGTRVHPVIVKSG